MLERAKSFRISPSEDKRGQMEDYTPFMAAFQTDEQALLHDAMEKNLHIPQEIISFAVLLGEMR